MPEDPQKPGGEPNLELPSLFSRRKKKRQSPEEPTGEAVDETAVAPAGAPEAESVGFPAEDPAAEPSAGEASAEAPLRAGPAPVAGSTRRVPPTPPPPARDPE